MLLFLLELNFYRRNRSQPEGADVSVSSDSNGVFARLRRLTAAHVPIGYPSGGVKADESPFAGTRKGPYAGKHVNKTHWHAWLQRQSLR